jgi:anti-anti-sigma factor
MGDQDFSVVQDQSGIFHIDGELTISQAEKFKDFLGDLLEKRRSIRLSLEGVTFLDTSALQLLISFRNALAPHARLQIIQTSPDVDKILALSGLASALLS